LLYICIFSNKFDLKQTIRVLHRVLEKKLKAKISGVSSPDRVNLKKH
jgi:hypothetical protein